MALKGNLSFKGSIFPDSVRRIEKITKVVKPNEKAHIVIEVATYLGEPQPKNDFEEDPAVMRQNFSCTPEQYAATFANSANLQADAYTHLKTFPEFSGLADC